jgi:hypothetical protein
MSNNQAQIMIRPATGADVEALAKLAELDSGRIPERPLLTAHIDGELQAAVSIGDGAAIANPFRPTAELVSMMRIEAGVSPRPANGLRAYRRLWPRPPRPAAPRPSSPSVPGIPALPAPR